MTKQRQDKLALFLGFGLVVLGVWLLVERVAGPLLAPLRRALDFVQSIGWPLAVILLGVLLIIGFPKIRASELKGIRLYRSRTDKMISGVLGGVAEFIGTDPTWIRLGYVLFTLIVGVWPAIGLYVIAAIVVPKTPENPAEIVVEQPTVVPPAPKPPAAPPVPPIPGTGSDDEGRS